VAQVTGTGLCRTDYRRLSSLPTDADAMYAWMRTTAVSAVVDKAGQRP